MERISRDTVEHRIKNGYNFELGEYLTNGFKIFSKEWLLFSLYGLVVFFLLLVSFFTIIGFMLLLYPSMMGFAVAADKVEQGEKLKFNDFFGAFKNFGDYFILGALVVIGIILAFVPYFLAIFNMIESNNSAVGIIGMGISMIFMFVMVLGIYIIQILIFFAPYLIHFGNYSAKEAITASFKLSKKNFWWMLLFVFIVGIISGMGQYLCIVGAFATMAIGMLMNYSLVKKVLMTDQYSEIDEIGITNI